MDRVPAHRINNQTRQRELDDVGDGPSRVFAPGCDEQHEPTDVTWIVTGAALFLYFLMGILVALR
jgi:hypothetical protein